MKCEVCGGECWDNRLNKKNPKGPDFKCKNKACEWAKWLKPDEKAKLEAEEKANPEPVKTPQSRGPKEMLCSFVKDLVLKDKDQGRCQDTLTTCAAIMAYYNAFSISIDGTSVEKEAAHREVNPF